MAFYLMRKNYFVALYSHGQQRRWTSGQAVLCLQKQMIMHYIFMNDNINAFTHNVRNIQGGRSWLNLLLLVNVWRWAEDEQTDNIIFCTLDGWLACWLVEQSTRDTTRWKVNDRLMEVLTKKTTTPQLQSHRRNGDGDDFVDAWIIAMKRGISRK